MRFFTVLFVFCAGLECLIFNPTFARAGEPMQSATDNGNLLGYLVPNALPDSLALLPPPPKTGSQAFALDEEVSRESLSLQGSPRWVLAAKDADLSFPHVADSFSCALGAPITKQETPHLYLLLVRTLKDASAATKRAKNYYARPRPFMVNQKPTCTPDAEKDLRNNGSYPSGHTTIGWALALVLSEIAPERADALLARGRAFGESRIVCNVHWQSDVAEGRVMGAATVARLHADPGFRADLEAARAELGVVRAKGLKSQLDCSAEAAALGK
ncbi:MAG: phosphatase PAP2 family protein [Oryzomonas sp.]|uniref:acid phosphatase n=1 Tax=Oryzomonas sp. TaxID=2855186 RepID=UPI0028518FBC|nr:phosphatase PAP2 family protein [Oryzomonas sp.]